MGNIDESALRIQEGAMELFRKFGIKGISMDDIALELGMSKKTIYQHYANKGDIVLHIVRNTLSRMREAYGQSQQKAENAIEEYLTMMQTTHAMYCSVSSMFFADLQRYYPEAWHIWEEFQEQVMMPVAEAMLKRGISEGLFRENLDIVICARMRIANTDATLNHQLFPPDRFDFTYTLMQFMTHYLYGCIRHDKIAVLEKYLAGASFLQHKG